MQSSTSGRLWQGSPSPGDPPFRKFLSRVPRGELLLADDHPDKCSICRFLGFHKLWRKSFSSDDHFGRNARSYSNNGYAGSLPSLITTLGCLSFSFYKKFSPTMSDPHISISLDAERIPWGGQEYAVNTSFGLLSVFVCGDQRKPALITYSDIALNYMSCFQGLFFCAEAASLLFHNFCVYHIDAPGHELGAAALASDQPILSPDDLADQVGEVLDYFGLPNAICMGVMAGAYILSLFALKQSERVLGLILISPLCRAPSWSEWFVNKLMVNFLYFYGMSNMVKDTLLGRYFSQELVKSDSDIVRACRRLLDERQGANVMRFLQSIHRRRDITSSLKKLNCRILMFAGEHSPFFEEAIHMSKELDRRSTALVEVQACGSLVTEEQPHSMLIPIEYFLMGYGFYRPVYYSNNMPSPTSPLSPPCISPELLSPESLGLKLKPIRTRIVDDEEF